jgi:Ni/Fe-hydrogenase subunit HybB-like protein
MTARAQPLGGRIFTPAFNVALLVFLAGCALMLYRFVFGLATITNLSDGYTWGIWKPLNVVTITGIGAGAYGLALLCYVANRVKYKPLVRPALLVGALAYTVGGASVLVDLGRWWNILKVPGYFWRWNGTSILLEVALCVLSYMLVLWVEVVPSVLEKLQDANPWAARWLPRVEAVTPFLIALGIVLPTMHQSSLGSLFIISSTLHPLWHTGWLGGLFLLSCLMMGYSGVVCMDTLVRLAMGWKQDRDLLPGIAKLARWFPVAWLGLRLADLAWKGRLGLLFAPDRYSVLFWIESGLAVWGAAILFTEEGRFDPGKRFWAAILLILSGALYRFDTYVIALRPLGQWSYFPSLGEITVALSLWSMAFCVFVLLSRRFPIIAAPAKV